MTETLCHCGKPVGDAVLCVACALRLDEALAQTCEHHGLGWDLDIAIARQARIDRPSGRPAVEARDEVRQWPGTLRPTPLLYEQAAVTAALVLRAALHRWASVVAHGTGVHAPTNVRGIGPACRRRCTHGSCRAIPAIPAPPHTLTGLAAWLRPRVGWLRHHHDGQRAQQEILSAVRAARAAVDRPAERLYAGPCDECGEDMYGRPGARIVECPPCELVYEVEARRQWLLRSAEDVLATATEIARAITRLGQPVTPEAIRGLVHRKQLFAHGVRPVGKREVPVYRLGDVLDVLAQRAAREGQAMA